MKYYIYGEVFFSSNNKRNAAGRRLDSRVANLGFVAEAFQGLVDAYGSWPAGRQDISVGGLAGIRLSYMTTDQDLAFDTYLDIIAAWDVFQDSSSWWGVGAAL